MSERQKETAAKIAEAVNAMPEKEQERFVDFIQGAAFMAAQQSKKESE